MIESFLCAALALGLGGPAIGAQVPVTFGATLELDPADLPGCAISIGVVTSGTPASATLTGPCSAMVLDLVIPPGEPGSAVADGKVVLTANDPLASDGADGDVAITGSGFVWGPKAGGQWPASPFFAMAPAGHNHDGQYAALMHGHIAGEISGLGPLATQPASLPATGTQFLRDDGVFAAVPGGTGGGVQVFSEQTAPDPALGVDGDVWIDYGAVDVDLYVKEAGAWVFKQNLRGPPGTGGGSGASIAFAEVPMSGDVSAALQAAFDSHRIVAPAPGSGNVTATIALPSGAQLIGAGGSRNGTDSQPNGTIFGTSFRVPAGALTNGCVFHRADHGNGLSLERFNLWGFGNIPAENRTGICIDGLGNVSTIEKVFIRNFATGIRLGDAPSDEATSWYGSIRDVMLENISGCGILIDGGLNGGGRGFAQLMIQSTDFHDIDGPRLCIRNIQPGSAIIVSGGIWGMDGFTNPTSTAPAIDITNSPRVSLKVEGVTFRAGAGDIFIRVDRDDYQITLDSNTLGADSLDPANPIFCALAVDAPTADVPCNIGGRSAVLLNGRQPVWQ